jgi:hypothetical protein
VKPVIDTPEGSPAAGAALIGRVLPAIASGNCSKVAGDFPSTKTASSTRTPANCFGHDGTPLQKLLKQGIGSVKSLGGNARVEFFQVEVGPKGTPRTFVVELFKQKGALRIYGAFPGPVSKKAAKHAKAKKKH